jgi:amino-acid N-acetyltransferase
MGSSDERLGPARRDELEVVLALVGGAGLPTVGVADHFPGAYVVARSGSNVVAVAGLEVYGDVGLLRSVAVSPAAQGSGLGQLLVADRLHAARGQNLRAVYLLTTTAADYFRHLGFEETPRSGAPVPLLKSSEFSAVCPASAVCFAKIVS